MKIRVLGGRRTWAILALVALMASVLAVAPAAAGSETYEYQFEFVNGQTISGVASDKTALLTNAGGAFADAPSGMIVHLSCSDKFSGGWGEKDGPKPEIDSAWQIASFSISKIKDGKVDKTCSSQADRGCAGRRRLLLLPLRIRQRQRGRRHEQREERLHSRTPEEPIRTIRPA